MADAVDARFVSVLLVGTWLFFDLEPPGVDLVLLIREALRRRRRRRRAPRRLRPQLFLRSALETRVADAGRFRGDFRLTPPVFDLLLERLRPALLLRGALATSPEAALLVTLFRLGSRSLLHNTAEHFGMSTASAFRLFWRTVDAINQVLLPEVVRWPRGADLAAVRDGFAAHGIVGAVGAIDCTHVCVHPPVADSNAYADRSRRHSVVAQAVVDHTGLFRDAFVGCAGSLHDMRVFKESSLFERITRGEVVTDDDFLVADSGYACRAYTVTPFDRRGGGAAPTSLETAFNVAHARTRGIVERSFGQLKGRYRILLDSVEGRVQNVHKVITACIALHNFGLLNGEPPMALEDGAAAEDAVPAPRPMPHTESVALRQGHARRDRVFAQWRRHIRGLPTA